jgi:hypothetical protein
MATYVGRLFSIKAERIGTIEVRPCAVGVDDQLGMVVGRDVEILKRGEYYGPPKKGECYRLQTVWYERYRPEWNEDHTDPDDGRYWFHDVEPTATVVVGSSNLPAVWFDAPDVSICAQSGAFLCG